MVERLCYIIMVALLLYYITAAKAEGAFRCSDNDTYVSRTCSSSLGKFETCSLQDINSIITRVLLNASDSRCSNGKGNFSFDEKRNLLTVYNGCLVKAEMCKNVSDTIISSTETVQPETTDLKVAAWIPVLIFVFLVAVLVIACVIYRRKGRCACCRNIKMFRHMKNFRPSTGECSSLTESSAGPVYAVPLIKSESKKIAHYEEVYSVPDDGTNTPFPDPTYDHALVKGSYDICSLNGDYTNRKTLNYNTGVNQKPT